jgi:hypothetical protein
MTSPGRTVNDLDIAIDLATVQRAARQDAESVMAVLGGLRRRHDLSGIEYTRKVRVAPWEIPHSHPVLTLNTRVTVPDDVLATYVHEQMHWYAAWFNVRHRAQWSEIIAALNARYPDARTRPLEGACDGFSTVLHLVVNWLELDALRELLGRDAAVAAVQRQPVYGWVYATVIADWEELEAHYTQHGLAPRLPAAHFTEEDRALAASADS